MSTTAIEAPGSAAKLSVRRAAQPVLVKQDTVSINSKEGIEVGQGSLCSHLAVSPDHLFVAIGKYIYVLKDIKELDLLGVNGKVTKKYDMLESIQQLTMSKDGKLLAFAQQGGLTVCFASELADHAYDKTRVFVWDRNVIYAGVFKQVKFNRSGSRLTVITNNEMVTYKVILPVNQQGMPTLEVFKTLSTAAYSFDYRSDGSLVVGVVMGRILILDQNHGSRKTFELRFVHQGSHKISRLTCLRDDRVLLWAVSTDKKSKDNENKIGYLDLDVGNIFKEITGLRPSNFILCDDRSFGRASVMLLNERSRPWPEMIGFRGNNIEVLPPGKKLSLPLPSVWPISMVSYRHHNGEDEAGHVLILCSDLTIHIYRVMDSAAKDALLYNALDSVDDHEDRLGEIEREKKGENQARAEADQRLNTKLQQYKAEVMAEVMAEVKAAVMAEVRAEVMAEVKAAVMAEVKAAVMAEMRAEVIAEVRA